MQKDRLHYPERLPRAAVAQRRIAGKIIYRTPLLAGRLPLRPDVAVVALLAHVRGAVLVRPWRAFPADAADLPLALPRHSPAPSPCSEGLHLWAIPSWSGDRPRAHGRRALQRAEGQRRLAAEAARSVTRWLRSQHQEACSFAGLCEVVGLQLGEPSEFLSRCNRVTFLDLSYHSAVTLKNPAQQQQVVGVHRELRGE